MYTLARTQFYCSYFCSFFTKLARKNYSKAIFDQDTSFNIKTYQMYNDISKSSQAAIIKYYRLDDLNNRNLFPTVLILGSPRSKCQTTLMTHSNPNYLPEASSLNIITPSIRTSIHEFRWDTNCYLLHNNILKKKLKT